MKKENIVVEDKIKDVIDANDVALEHLSKEGIVVFTHEIVAICKRRLSWLVEIDGKTFTGVVLIESKTGKVLTANRL
jgi:hypothetical protein